MTTCKPSDPAAVRKAHDGPLDCYIDLFVQRLREQQFSPESVRTQVLHVADLSRWLHARELSVDALTAAVIDAHCQGQRPGVQLRRGHRIFCNAAYSNHWTIVHQRYLKRKDRGVERVAANSLPPTAASEQPF